MIWRMHKHTWRLQIVDRNDLARQLAETSHLSGNFLLRSGKQSTHYFDKYLFAANPRILKELADQLKLLIPSGTDVLAGIELGGVVIGTAVGLSASRPIAFVRKERKEYGTLKIVEGTEVRGLNVCLVEDVVSTGGQIAKSAESLRQEGAIVTAALCVVDRTDGKADALQKAGIRLFSLFTSDELDYFVKGA
jgi:orotate phosphoribosyltransferase